MVIKCGLGYRVKLRLNTVEFRETVATVTKLVVDSGVAGGGGDSGFLGKTNLQIKGEIASNMIMINK